MADFSENSNVKKQCLSIILSFLDQIILMGHFGQLDSSNIKYELTIVSRMIICLLRSTRNRQENKWVQPVLRSRNPPEFSSQIN